jgi:hypothetical protein
MHTLVPFSSDAGTPPQTRSPRRSCRGHVEANVGAMNVKLTPAELAKLDELTRR